MAKNGMLPGASTVIGGSPVEQVVIPSRHELRTGMEYDMDYNILRIEAPQNAPPVARSSLAQTTLIHRYQSSKYISRLTRVLQGFRPDYPAFHGFKIVNGAPEVSNTGEPVLATSMNRFYTGIGTEGIAPFPKAANAGTMKPLSRFVKALPVPITQYQAPTYSVQE